MADRIPAVLGLDIGTTEAKAALVGLDGRILSANPVMCHMVGYSEAELLERSALDITHEEDRALTAEWLRKLPRDPGGTAKFDKR